MAPGRSLGRYILYGELASGGMATVHLGRLMGPIGFARTVAVKRLFPAYARDPEFKKAFIDEARLAARVHHTNVVQTLDVVEQEDEALLVMEYVHGESFAGALRASASPERCPSVAIIAAILSGVLRGLHAAHEATDERGEPLGVVHRDVSPQNILVGSDGVARVLDFGVAKATGQLHTTREGQLKGKLAYMAPEQLSGEVSRQRDVYSASVVLWEALTGRRLFHAQDERELVSKILFANPAAPGQTISGIPPELDAVVLKGIAREVSERFQTAREMAVALEQAIPIATPAQVADWLESSVGPALAEGRERVREIESSSWSGADAFPLESHATNVSGDGRPISADERSIPSIARTARTPDGRVGATRLWVGAVLLFLAGATSALLFARTQSRSGAPPPATSTSTETVAAAPSVPAPSSTPVTSQETAKAPSSPSTPSQTREPEPGTNRRPSRRSPLAASPPVTTPSASASTAAPSAGPDKKTCDPPYRLGSRGEKVWIPECL
jgi:serine/threonine protein kinase